MNKEIMIEFEIIRKTGITNMFDYYTVISLARKAKLKNIAKLTYDEYKHFLLNFKKYKKKYL